MACAEVRGGDLAGSAEAACELVWVLGEVAGDVAERELRQDRRGPLALEEKAEGLPHDLLEVVVAELEPLTEPVGHRHLVGRLTITFAHLDPELPGRHGLMLMSAMVRIPR